MWVKNSIIVPRDEELVLVKAYKKEEYIRLYFLELQLFCHIHIKAILETVSWENMGTDQNDNSECPFLLKQK